GGRTLVDRSMVRRRQDFGAARTRRRPRRAHGFHPEKLGKNLFRLVGEYRALVCFPPALVGASNSGLVWSRRDRFRRRKRGAGTDGGGSPLWCAPIAPTRRRRP